MKNKEELEEFCIILQNRKLNLLTYVDTRLGGRETEITNGEIKFAIDDKLSLLVKDGESLPIPTSAWMLMDIILIELAGDVNRKEVNILYKKFLEMRGLKDSGCIRKQLKLDLRTLSNISYFDYNAKSEVFEVNFGFGEMIDGYINFKLSKSFAKELKKSKVMEYSIKALKVNYNKSRHAYYLQKLIDRNYRLNEGKDRLATMGIRSILQNLPYMPSKSEVKSRYREKIISPFFKNLDYLEIKYKFQDKKGNEICKEKVTYQEFIEAKIKIDYSFYPQHPERIEAYKSHHKKKISDVEQ